jgi:flagellar biogenesis protein FliO
VVVAGLLVPQLLSSAVPLLDKSTPEKSAAGEPKAKTDLSYTPPSMPSVPDARLMLTRLVVGTGVVLGLCVLTLWLCKRWLVRLPAKTTGLTQLTVVETLALGNRCSVHLLHAANRQVLIGVDGTGIKTMIALPELFAGDMLEAQGKEGRLESEPALASYRAASSL